MTRRTDANACMCVLPNASPAIDKSRRRRPLRKWRHAVVLAVLLLNSRLVGDANASVRRCGVEIRFVEDRLDAIHLLSKLSVQAVDRRNAVAADFDLDASARLRSLRVHASARLGIILRQAWTRGDDEHR